MLGCNQSATMDGPKLRTVPLLASADVLAERNDDDLMLLAAAGREEAFAHLVERHMPQLLRYCCKQVCDTKRGEEIAQDSWLKLWAYRMRYQPQGKFRILLYTTARNLCRNHARNSARRSRWFSDLPAPTLGGSMDQPSQLDALIAREKATRIQDAMASLKPKLREALVLRFDQGLEYEEIAVIVGRSESTVRSRIFHGLKKLKSRIEGELR